MKLPVQFVWWWDSWRLASYGPMPEGGHYRGCIYRWRIQVGPLEVRRWRKAP